MAEITDSEQSAAGASTATKVLAAIGVAIALAGGFYLLGNYAADGKTAFWIAASYWVLVCIGALLVARRRRDLRVPLVAAVVLMSAAAGVFGLLYGRDTEVDEKIVTGAPTGEGAAPSSDSGGAPAGDGAPAKRPRPQGNVQVATGAFEGVSGHTGTGKASVVRLPNGESKLTFSSFDVDPGAGPMALRVYLAAGKPGSDGEVKDFKELGTLKGTKGNQQYTVPRGLDLKRYDSAIVWCVTFSTRIAQAPLR